MLDTRVLDPAGHSGFVRKLMGMLETEQPPLAAGGALCDTKNLILPFEDLLIDKGSKLHQPISAELC